MVTRRRPWPTKDPAGSAAAPAARMGSGGMSGDGATFTWTNQLGDAAYDLAPALGTLPKLIPAGGAWFKGGLNAYLTTPDSAANSLTSDLDIRVVGTMVTGIPSTIQTYCAKWGFAEKSYSFRQLPTTGYLDLTITTNGLDATAKSYTSTVAPSAGQSVNVLFVGDVGGGGESNSQATFYTSDDDGDTWDQLGTPVTDTIGDIFDSTNALEIGAILGGAVYPMTGAITSVELYELGIQKTSMKPADYVTGSTFTSAETSEVYTINGDVDINPLSVNVVSSDGTVVLEPSSGTTISSPFVIFIVARILGTPTRDNYIFAARSDTTKYCALFTDFSDSNKWTISQDQGTQEVLATFDNDWHIFTVEYNGDATTTLTVSDVGTVSADVGADDFDYISLMADVDGTKGMVGELGKVIVYNRSMVSGEIMAVQAALTTEFGL